MWQCDNCGYTDEDGTTFEEETEESLEDTVRYCPECGSDEVFLKDEEQDLDPLEDKEDFEPDEKDEEDLGPDGDDDDEDDLGDLEDEDADTDHKL
jgi:ribosomal protein S27AE